MVRKHKTERFLPQPLTKEEWIRHHLETADAVVYSVEEFLKAAGNLPKESEIFFFRISLSFLYICLFHGPKKDRDIFSLGKNEIASIKVQPILYVT